MKVCPLLLIACTLAAQAPPPAAPPADPASGLEPSLKQFIDVLSTVHSHAATAPSVDKMVYEGAIPSMLRQLDPHTQFFDPGQFQQLKQMQDSEQKGFGSVVSVLPGQVIFLQTLPGTPSNKAGIQAGDELVAINNIAIRSLPAEQIIQLLTEARQQKITAFVRRQGDSHVAAVHSDAGTGRQSKRGPCLPIAPGLRLHSHHELGHADRQAIARCR